MRRSVNPSHTRSAHRPRRFGRRLVPALAVGALVLAACGSDDDAADTADTTAGSAAPADTTAGSAGPADPRPRRPAAAASDCSATIETGHADDRHR